MSEDNLNNIPGAAAYMNVIQSLLNQIVSTQGSAIEKAASAVVKAIQQGGLIYLFGSGHSHMLVEEGHYRAGGLAPVTPILVSELMIHESAISSSSYERLPGLAPVILKRYQVTDKDIIFIFSNSGVNAVPVEMALEAHKVGMTIIAVLSRSYSQQAPLSSLGKRLYEIADIVLDNQLPPGDAVVQIEGSGLRCGPASTIVGAFLLNAVLTEATFRLAAEGVMPPVYISSNMPGAKEHNRALLEQYKPHNPHL